MTKISDVTFGRELFDLLNSDLESRSVELNALFLQSLKLQEAYNTILPKVTPRLIDDLFARLQENPHIKQPIYMMEIFTKEIKRKDKGTIAVENDQFREYLISISGGSVPAIYDHDSHYVINMKLTFDILKALNDIDFVLQKPQEQFKTPIEKEKEIEHADDDDSRQHKLNTIIASKDSSQLGIPFKHRKNYLISNSLKTTICIIIATAGIASLVNLVVNGDIIMPNTGISLLPQSSILKQTSDYGTVDGMVIGQPAAAAKGGGSVTVYKVAGLVDSLEKSAGYTKTSIISPAGHFMFKLPSGAYRIIVVHPNGKDQIIENYAVWPGSHTSLNLTH